MNTRNFNLLTYMFFIALISFQNINSMELGSHTFITKLEKYRDLKTFQRQCYYDLKTDLVITSYVKKIRIVVRDIFKENKDLNKNHITFEQFWMIFKKGKYGQIAHELSHSETYVRSYYNYFKKNDKMNEADLFQFMGLYYLEGELLVEDQHPTLSKYFSNEHEVSDRFGCNITIAFWDLVNKMLLNIYVKYNWDHKTMIGRKEIFSILIETITGRCWLKNDKDCIFFNKFVTRAQGFYNLSSGRKVGCNVHQTKIMFASFLFKDISWNECNQKKFDENLLKTKVSKILKDYEESK